jgi:hypothetical protein
VDSLVQYPDYLRRGFPIGSGAVEGACKHVVADRFGGGGMRWKLETADPVIQLLLPLEVRELYPACFPSRL